MADERYTKCNLRDHCLRRFTMPDIGQVEMYDVARCTLTNLTYQGYYILIINGEAHKFIGRVKELNSRWHFNST